jgi:DNA-binding MarR family transcriptional regulator
MQTYWRMTTPSRKSKQSPSADPQAFYRGDDYRIEDSIGHLVRQLIGSMNRGIDLRMQPYDLTALQWKPLLMLKLGRADTAAGLARENCSDNGAMTRMLDRLEVKGLIRRTRSDTDRRIVRLALTPEGERVGAMIPFALSEVLNEHLEGFAPAEFTQLQALLRRMIANGALSPDDDGASPGDSP